jgi:hypothetical protein
MSSSSESSSESNTIDVLPFGKYCAHKIFSSNKAILSSLLQNISWEVSKIYVWFSSY